MSPNKITEPHHQNITKADSPAKGKPKAKKQATKRSSPKVAKNNSTNNPVKSKKTTKKKPGSKQLGSSPTETNMAQHRSSGRGIAWLALVLSVLALVAGAYAAYQTTLSQQVTSVQATGIDDRVKLLLTDQQNLKYTLGDLRDKTDQMNQDISAQMNSLGSGLKSAHSSIEVLQTSSAKSIDEVKSDLGQSVARWRLDELRSLLRHVDRYYQFTNDIKQTKMGLQLARSNLANMQNSRLAVVKTALAEDILRLDANEGLDMAALNTRLTGMSALIPDLSLAEDKVEPTAGASQGEDSTMDKQTGGVLSFGKAIFGDIGRLVKHKNLDATPIPSLDNSARFVLYESLQLNLQTAMVALLRRDNALYQSQLQLANDSLSRYFDLDQANAKTLLAELDAVRAENISQKIEPVSSALLALDRILMEGNQ